MKTCTKCNETKPLEEYHKHRAGRYPACKACRSKSSRKYYQENLEKYRESQRKYRQENLEKVRERSRKWVKENPEKVRENTKKYYQENSEKVKGKNRKYRQENPEKCAALSAKRRFKKLQATPHWLTEYQHKQIELKYWISQFLTDYTGIQHHVDHIHPLQGENICGLHVPENLQILTAEENLRKSNSH